MHFAIPEINHHDVKLLMKWSEARVNVLPPGYATYCRDMDRLLMLLQGVVCNNSCCYRFLKIYLPHGWESPRSWINEWKNEGMNEWKNEGMNKQSNEWMVNERMNEQTNEWMKLLHLGGLYDEIYLVFSKDVHLLISLISDM